MVGGGSQGRRNKPASNHDKMGRFNAGAVFTAAVLWGLALTAGARAETVSASHRKVLLLGQASQALQDAADAVVGAGQDVGNAAQNAVSRGYDRIYVKNGCSRPIWVAILYATRPVPNFQGSMWTAAGWCKLDPGEKNFIASTENSNVYFYAENSAEQLYWSGGHRSCKAVRGDTVCDWIPKNTGPVFTDFTQTFTCS